MGASEEVYRIILWRLPGYHHESICHGSAGQGPNLASSFEELAVANCTMLTWQNNKPQQATELGKASASVVAVVMKPQ